jgi:hypothetical protein
MEVSDQLLYSLAASPLKKQIPVSIVQVAGQAPEWVCSCIRKMFPPVLEYVDSHGHYTTAYHSSQYKNSNLINYGMDAQSEAFQTLIISASSLNSYRTSQ